jgi:catalase-peroxidase
MLVDKAQLTLTAPEMTVLVGGMRVLNTNFDQSQNGAPNVQKRLRMISFCKLDLGTTWKAVSESDDAFIGSDRMAGGIKWVGTRVDLIFPIQS